MSAIVGRVQAYILPSGEVVLEQPRGDHRGLVLVPESRLLAAEARVREVEKMLDMTNAELAWSESDGRRVSAERDALVPLARAGLNAYDYVLAKEQYGNATVPLLDRVSIDESLSAARAILDRRDREAK